MADIDRLARLEGELWARRVRDQLVRWDGPLQMDWPGRTAEAHTLASMLTANERIRERLAKVIQERAADVWQALNDNVT
jgi:hypothetical protein